MKHDESRLVDSRFAGGAALDRGAGAGQVVSLAVSEAMRDTLTMLVIDLVEDMIAHPEASEPSASGLCSSPPIPRSCRLVARYGSSARCGAGQGPLHAGLDFTAPRGAPVVAVRPGVVEQAARGGTAAARSSGYGPTVVIYHDDEDLVTVYSHLADITVETGTYVEAGQPIGSMGSSHERERRGMGMGVHLHFEVCGRGRDGESPFPWDPCRAHRSDPEPWLRSHGIAFNSCGLLVGSNGR